MRGTVGDTGPHDEGHQADNRPGIIMRVTVADWDRHDSPAKYGVESSESTLGCVLMLALFTNLFPLVFALLAVAVRVMSFQVAEMTAGPRHNR